MKLPARRFDVAPAVRARTPLIICITGPSGSGKTYSALRLARGIQRVVGGKIGGIDTENKRMLHYAPAMNERRPEGQGWFKFHHIDFQPPFGPLDYLVAFEAAKAAGCKVVVADSMSHEHTGPGGVLDQIEEFLTRKAGDDWDKRNRYNMLANVKPKGERKRLNDTLIRLGVDLILCYRADDKIKPAERGAADKEPVHIGWQPETTSKLYYDATVRFLLLPGSDGRPTLNPKTEAEKQLIKDPEQFRGWWRAGMQLNEEMGEKMARWAEGGEGAPPTSDESRREEDSSSPEPASSPRTSRTPSTSERATKIRGFASQLGWSTKQMAEWLRQKFGTFDVDSMSDGAFDDAVVALEMELEAKSMPEGDGQ